MGAVARACADAIYLGQFVQSKYIIVIITRLSLFVKQMFWEDPKYGKSDVFLWEITTDFTKWARYSLKMLFGCMMQKKNITYRAFVGKKYFRIRSYSKKITNDGFCCYQLLSIKVLLSQMLRLGHTYPETEKTV